MANQQFNYAERQFDSLRQEINECKTRAFWTLILAMAAALAHAVIATFNAPALANTVVPVLLLVLVMAYAMEQNAIIRAGRYLREQLEQDLGYPGWENWLESNSRFREIDRFFFAGFLISFLILYLATCWSSIEQLNRMSSPLFAICGLVVYGLGGLCVFIVLLRHWHSCTTTKA
jgi:hypothetical protein